MATALRSNGIYSGIVDALPGHLVNDFIEEIKTGWLRERVHAEINNKRLGAANHREHTRKSVDGLGRLRMEVDPTSYHFWGHKLGYECWKDKGFLREYERDNPECRVDCGGTRLQVGYGSGASARSVRFRKSYDL